MAKKKYPRKFRQARAAAKPAAKAAFPGKVKAKVKDPTVKYSADDAKILREIKDEAKRGYITDDKGNKVYSRPTETAKERIARERAEAMRKFREGTEDGDGKKPTKKKSFSKKKTPVKKAAVKKPTVKAATVVETKPAKKQTRAEKSAANKAKWAKMTPAERKNWSASKAGSKGEVLIQGKKYDVASGAADKKMSELSKAQTPKGKATPVYSITDVQPEKASKGAKKAKFVQKKSGTTVAKTTTATPKPGTSVATRAKGTVATTGSKPKPVATAGKPKAATAAKGKGSRFAGAAKKFGKASAAFALGAEVVSLAKGSTKKDFNEINRLEAKLARLTGKEKSAVTRGRQGAGMQAANLAALTTFGAVGQTRRERMDELNKLIAKAEKNKNKNLRYGPDGSSLVPGTSAYKAGSKVRPSYSASKPTAGGSVTTPGAGGSTTKVTPGNVYVVKKGDTLSGIAKASGVSLAELRAANKKFAKNPKYKQGNMIWSGTTVKIPKKK